MSQEIDISWQVLRQIVADQVGESAELVEVKPLIGGCINTTLALTLRDASRFVIKISPHRVNRAYEEEAHQLNLLRSAGVPTPEVYACEIGSLDKPFSYILMEFIDGIDLSEVKHRCPAPAREELQRHLAELVLAIHAQRAGHYRRATRQENGRYDDWAAFYRKVYDPIFKEAEKSALLPVKYRRRIGKIHDRLERLLAHDDVPRLVHGDLWGNNVLAAPDADGRWRIRAVLDPNCKYAHVESEIAYMELFGTVTPTFLKVYQQTHRLPANYHQIRKPVYQLYPLLNHFQLFGEEYLKPLTAAVDRVAG